MFPAQKMSNLINFNTHLSNKDEMHKEADPADDKSKISRLTGAQNHRGNISTAVVRKLSTVTN